MPANKISSINLILLTSLVLVFLAANSLFCKAALVDNSIDPFSFTFFRLFFASLTLMIILYFNENKLKIDIKSNWLNSFFLFLYAISFSYSYLSLDAGLGALILFAMVQITMIVFALIKKEIFSFRMLFGVLIAFGGLAFLLFPKDDFKISFLHFFLMIIAGFAWAFYTILGKNSKDALITTTNSFLKTLVLSLLFFIFFVKDINLSSYGLFLAFLSGSITSGIAYYLWYVILKNIKIITASVIQLLIPIIAIFLSVIFLDENLSFTLIISTSIILSGIIISLYKK